MAHPQRVPDETLRFHDVPEARPPRTKPRVREPEAQHRRHVAQAVEEDGGIAALRRVLLRGQVLKGMKPTDEPADYKKKTAAKVEQGVNDPMMPVAWTREVKNDAGKVNRILCTTMGSATDLQNEGLRRLVVNSIYWGLDLDVPAQANVEVVGEFKPTMYGFNGFIKGMKAADHELK